MQLAVYVTPKTVCNPQKVNNWFAFWQNIQNCKTYLNLHTFHFSELHKFLELKVLVSIYTNCILYKCDKFLEHKVRISTYTHCILMKCIKIWEHKVCMSFYTNCILYKCDKILEHKVHISTYLICIVKNCAICFEHKIVNFNYIICILTKSVILLNANQSTRFVWFEYKLLNSIW